MTNESIIADLEYKGYCASKSDWQIKKFADKLKDIVCILIGCTREQLEDREFKEKELGEEWWYYTNTLFYNKDKELVPYLQANKFIHNSNQWYIIKLTPRLLMQLLGTEAGREIIHPNIWVNALMSEYKGNRCEHFGKCLCGSGEFSDGSKGLALCETERPKWIITDMRFPNELQAVKDKGGISIRVKRPDLIESNHPSEISLDSATFDFVINNDKDIEHLINEVKKILEKLSII